MAKDWTTEQMAAKLAELKGIDSGKPAAPAPAATAAAAPATVAAAAKPAAVAAATATATAAAGPAPGSFQGFRPAIDLDKPRYPQTSFGGRMRHFLDIIDPRTLLTTDAKLAESQDIIKRYKSGALKVGPATSASAGTITEEGLWAAKKVRDAVIHPDTQEKVFLGFRMSAFVPVNIPIVVGMISSQSAGAQLFWQWFNQSYNVAVNYANRNISSPMPMDQVAASYAGAVATSCGLAVGFNRLIRRADTWSPTVRTLVKSLGPYTAVASAGAVNVLLMRRNEARDGIQVKAKSDGQVVGVSQIAGRKGLEQVTLSRVFLPLPVLALPGLVMGTVDALWPAIKANRRVRMPLEVGVVAASLWAGLPAAIGLFPQDCEMNVKDLEPKFHNLKDSKGQPITTIYFNKGL